MGFFSLCGEVPVIPGTRGSGEAAQVGEQVLQLVLCDDLSDQVVLVLCAKPYRFFLSLLSALSMFLAIRSPP